jgi:hypothetical protein
MSSFVKYSITFLVGVYVGQEVSSIPNVKKYTLNAYKEIMKSDFVKEIKKDLK